MNDHPDNLTFEQLLAMQRPQHNGDLFSARHPKMDLARRAKIFSPFDALRGFDAAIDIAKDTTAYVPKRELDESETAVLNDKLCRLSAIFRYNKQHHRTTTATVTYFVPKGHDTDDEPVGEYVTVRDDVTAISREGQYLVVDMKKIKFHSMTDLALH